MKIKTFLICDDIRSEIGGKHSIIGLYDDRIIFNVTPDKKDSWPKQMKLGIFLKIDFEKSKPSYFKFSIKYNDNVKPLVEGIIKKLPKEVKNNTLSLALVHPNFNFENQGKLIFYFDFLDENNKIIETVTPECELIVEEKVLD